MSALSKRHPDRKHFSPTATSTPCHRRLSPGLMQEYILPSTDLLSSSLLDPLLHIFHPESTAILLKPRTDDVACLLRILQWLFIPLILKFKNPYGEKTHTVPWPCLWLPFLLPLPLVTEFRSHCRSSAPQTRQHLQALCLKHSSSRPRPASTSSFLQICLQQGSAP